MQSLRPARLVLAGVLLLSGACGLAVPGASSKNSPTDSAGGAAASPASCAQDTDCPTGLVCQAQVCVASDGLPPETKDYQVFQQPET